MNAALEQTKIFKIFDIIELLKFIPLLLIAKIKKYIIIFYFIVVFNYSIK